MNAADLIPMVFVSVVFSVSIGYLLVEFVRARKVKN
mgnify:CR=1 FL=1